MIDMMLIALLILISIILIICIAMLSLLIRSILIDIEDASDDTIGSLLSEIEEELWNA